MGGRIYVSHGVILVVGFFSSRSFNENKNYTKSNEMRCCFIVYCSASPVKIINICQRNRTDHFFFQLLSLFSNIFQQKKTSTTNSMAKKTTEWHVQFIHLNFNGEHNNDHFFAIHQMNTCEFMESLKWILM